MSLLHPAVHWLYNEEELLYVNRDITVVEYNWGQLSVSGQWHIELCVGTIG